MGPPMAVDDLSLTVSTCSSPIGLQLTQATSTSAALTWATDVEGSYAVEARNAYQYDPFVPGFLVGSGSTDSGFHSISGLLTGMRSYTASVRRTCVNGSFSVWCEPVPFSTAPGCDGALLSLEAEEYLLEGADHSRVICPGVQGEAVTVTTLSFMADEPMTVFNGPGEDSPVLGIYTGNVSDEVLSSTDYSGCLTFQNIPMSVYVTTYLQASVSCGPKEHLVPWGLSATDISDHGALVQWNCLGCDDYSAYVEYGPIGFAPGQGMIAGDGTVLVSDSGSVRLNGLSSGTAYEVCVRAGSGPWDWSGDGPVPFTTTGSGTGIDEEGTAIIRLAPNPASDLVEVWIAGDDQRIDLIDAQGRTCRSLALPTGIERQQRIQLSDLPTGVYIVAIFGNDGRRSAFLIKY
ncbi:MAG: T9SS type A sorting domain-containing protein [Flavobacteriales bacterium]|nr:T9SS type A sorting domain-containing protein [Flavobacteriales bacterium]